MDLKLENKVNDAIEQLKLLSPDDINFQQMDPIAKMMLVALLNETQKIQDHIDDIDQRIVERYCSDFIPRQKVEAVPAITLINPTFKTNKDAENIQIGSGVFFSYKTERRKQPLNYIPLFNTLAIPYSDIIVLHQNNEYCKSTDMYKPNRLWICIKTCAEIESIKGLSVFIKGTN